MNFISKMFVASVLSAFGLVPVTAFAHTSAVDSSNPPYMGSSTVVGASSKCVKWSKRCSTKRYCRRSNYNCYSCRKYRGKGYYSTRRTCSVDSMRGYRTRGYSCYLTGKRYGGCHQYKKRTWCHTYCSKRVTY